MFFLSIRDFLGLGSGWSHPAGMLQAGDVGNLSVHSEERRVKVGICTILGMLFGSRKQPLITQTWTAESTSNPFQLGGCIEVQLPQLLGVGIDSLILQIDTPQLEVMMGTSVLNPPFPLRFQLKNYEKAISRICCQKPKVPDFYWTEFDLNTLIYLNLMCH